MPATADHSVAFGQWGPVPVELQQCRDIQPAKLARSLTADGRNALRHVGITVEDSTAENARLESRVFAVCLHTRVGESEFFWPVATDTFGCSIEVVRSGPARSSFFGMVAAEARD